MGTDSINLGHRTNLCVDYFTNSNARVPVWFAWTCQPCAERLPVPPQSPKIRGGRPSRRPAPRGEPQHCLVSERNRVSGARAHYILLRGTTVFDSGRANLSRSRYAAPNRLPDIMGGAFEALALICTTALLTRAPIRAAWVRLCAPSFRMISRTCTLTVDSCYVMSRSICLLETPWRSFSRN